MKETVRVYKMGTWEPELNEEVLLECQPNSDAVLAITTEFMTSSDCPLLITIIVRPSCCEIAHKDTKIRGTLKKYPRDPGSDCVYYKQC